MSEASIKGIAAALSLSIGTVDRALHGRQGINEQTRSRVLDKARELGYRPNYAARSLKLNRSLRVGVFLPAEFGLFFDAIRDGIRSAAVASSLVGLEPVFYRYPRLGEGDIEMLEAHREERFDACIVAPGNPEPMEPMLRSLIEDGTPVFCVATDAPRSGRMAAVTVEAYSSGAMAAELIARMLPTATHETSVAVMTGELSTLDHAEKLRGFRDGIHRWASGVSLLPVAECFEQPQRAYDLACSMLEGARRPDAIYVNKAHSAPVLRACEEHGLAGRVLLIATDFFPEMVPHLESGAVAATLHQRPLTQGKVVVEQLIRYLTEGKVERVETRLAPHLVMRSNLHLFLDAETRGMEDESLAQTRTPDYQK